MTRVSNAAWKYFVKIRGTKKALCKLCNEEYSYNSTTGNLKSHLKHKHHTAYIEIMAAQEHDRLTQNEGTEEGEDKVIYEYIVAESPTSSITNEPVEDVKRTQIRSARIQSRDSRLSLDERRRRQSHRSADKPREKHLIEELTIEKINVTALQKELVEKELEEKAIKLKLLQEEMEHKKEMYEWERREKEHKTEIYELEKQEKLLRIEILKANLENVRNNHPAPGCSLPTLE